LKGIFLFLLFPLVSWAFSGMARHGYNNCIACHVSPSGGGILNLYGREISKEVLSTWAQKNEQQAFYNLTPLREDFYVAAFARGLQLHRQNQSLTEGKPILMQADLESAYILNKKIIFDLTAGRQEYRTSSTHSTDRLYFRRYFIAANILGPHYLRSGKFQYTFGLNDPNHYSSVRRDFSFGQDSETFNYEYSYLGEKLNIYYAEVRGNPHDEKSYNKTKGRSLTTSYFFFNKNKIGTSILNDHDKNKSRGIYGVWGIYSFTKKLYADAEFNLQRKTNRPLNTKQNGYSSSSKVHYVVLKGVIPYLVWEKSYLDTKNPLVEKSVYGAGIDFFPRPHFELNLNYQREVLEEVKDSATNMAWLMLNIYL